MKQSNYTPAFLPIILLTISLATPTSYGAAEPTWPLFNILFGHKINLSAHETSVPTTVAVFEKIKKLIGEYAEPRKPVSAMGILVLNPGGQVTGIPCYTEGILQTVAERAISLTDILAIQGQDYRTRNYILPNPAHALFAAIYPIPNPDPLVQADASCAMDPSHPGITFVPGDIETFLSLHSSHFDIDKANKQALKAYKKLSKDDMDTTMQGILQRRPSLTQRFARWAGFDQKPQPSTRSSSSSSSENHAHGQSASNNGEADTGDGGNGHDNSHDNSDGEGVMFGRPENLYDPQINSVLPPEILNIIFKLLRKTATPKNTFIIAPEGFTMLYTVRPLLPSERVACILGATHHGHYHAILSHPSHWPHEHIEALKDRDPKKSRGLLSSQLVDDQTLAILAGTPHATFLVPSLAELLVKKKLTKKFYEANCKLMERDLLDTPEPNLVKEQQEQAAEHSTKSAP